MLATIRCFFKAKFLNYPFWRVKYEDGRSTRLLHYEEAKSLRDCIGGKLYIDYKNCS